MLESVGLSQLNKINSELMLGLQRISSGLKISKASDDPAGYAASKMFQLDIAKAQTLQNNYEREINSSSTISSKLDNAADVGLRIDSLIDTASNSTISADERSAIQNEINQLSGQLENTLSSIEGSSYSASQFNLDAASLQVGSEEDIALAKANIKSGVESIIGENQQTGIDIKLTKIKKNQEARNEMNLKSSLSTMRDTDLAEEMIGFTNKSILQQIAIKNLSTTMKINASKSLNLLA